MTQAAHARPLKIEVEQVEEPRRPTAEDEARHIQGLSEGVDVPAADDYITIEVIDENGQKRTVSVPRGDVVTCLGGHYRIADKVGLMPLMRFAHSASSGVDANDMEGLVAIYDMLRDCIDERDWGRFQQDMTVKKAEADDMMPVVQQTITLLAARPTRRPSDSSAGPRPITARSTGGSSLPPTIPTAGAEDLAPVEELRRRA